jgi:integrase
MRGSITRRGEHSWRIKFEAGRDPKTGKRLTHFVTVKGTKRDAQAELTRRLASLDAGTHVEPSKAPLATYLRQWIDGHAVSPKTVERYRQLIEQQVIPHLGALPLQGLRVAHVTNWHATLLKAGGKDGGSLSPQTVQHAHRVLSKALADACKREVLARNVASIATPPKVTAEEMTILNPDQVKAMITAMKTSPIYPHVVTLLATGMRRGELMGLQWSDIDLDGGKVRIARSLEKTKAQGLRLKTPKTKHGARTISLPAIAVVALQDRRKAQLETRVALGAGRLADDAFVFGAPEGRPRDPDWLSLSWRRVVAARKLPRVSLHALRHSHASALIASGADPVTVSRRLGHGSPAITMSVYAHLFGRNDEAAANAIDAAMGFDGA